MFALDFAAINRLTNSDGKIRRADYDSGEIVDHSDNETKYVLLLPSEWTH